MPGRHGVCRGLIKCTAIIAERRDFSTSSNYGIEPAANICALFTPLRRIPYMKNVILLTC